jgi:hypothetical protein
MPAVHAGSQSWVHHSFVRVNDDGIKPFLSDSVFEDLVIWQQTNGWAIMLSWLTQGMQRNISVRGVTVLHDDHDHDYPVDGCDPCVPNQATIGAVHGGDGTVTDVVVENVVVETTVWRPIWLGQCAGAQHAHACLLPALLSAHPMTTDHVHTRHPVTPLTGIDKSKWASQGGGRLLNWKLTNIKIAGGTVNSTILGAWPHPGSNCSVDGIHFHNLQLAGRTAKSAKVAEMDISNACSVDFSPREMPVSAVRA